MSEHTLSWRSASERAAAAVTTAALLVSALLLSTLVVSTGAPAHATAQERAIDPVTNGGIVTDTNYLSPDGTVRVLPLEASTSSVRVFSPDGHSLAYVKLVVDQELKEIEHELWVLEADGTTDRVAHLAEAPVYDLAWSRGGDSVAVTSAYFRPRSDETRSFLHVVDMDTGHVVELVDTTWDRNVRFGGVAWSHDGTRVALSVSNEYYEAYDVLWVSSADASVSSLTGNCAWSDWEVVDDCEYGLVTGGYRGLDMHPDGSRLVTMDHTGVYTVDATTGAETVLRDDGRNYNQLQWSPDGNRIAWTAVEEAGGVLDIVVRTDSAAGGDEKAVAHNVGSAWDWQPCLASACPTFGTPRGTVRIKLTDTSYGRRWIDASVSVKSGKKPAGGVDEIPVVLQRRTGGKWKKVYSNSAYLFEAGVYETRLRRPDAGTCRVKVRFPGDYEYEPKKFTSDTIRC